jgi:heme/copper-type cytochrome/quinol oxidase subunit 1
MLFALGFLLNFLIGGVTGVMVASPPVDYQAHDTYFVVAHFHYTLMGGAAFGIFAAIYFWWPKMTGFMLRERTGRWVAILMFVAFNLTFFPLHELGLIGMQRRIPDYPANLGWTGLNELSTLGAYLMGVAVLLFAWNVVESIRQRELAGNDPWEANTLEWITTSPPPEHNFTWLPPIRSDRPVFDWRHRDDPSVSALAGAGVGPGPRTEPGAPE